MFSENHAVLEIQEFEKYFYFNKINKYVVYNAKHKIYINYNTEIKNTLIIVQKFKRIKFLLITKVVEIKIPHKIQ